MQKTNISYLTHTWNPIAMRCSRVSEGCRECWHLRTADRLCKNPGLPEDERRALAGEGPFVLRERELEAPLRLKRPSVIGVQFMGDPFHEDVPDEFRDQVYAVMHGCDRHTYLSLTKRPDNLLRYSQTHFLPGYQGVGHIWHGVTICNQAEHDAKIDDFLWVPGRKFLSLEPLLGPVDLELEKPDNGAPIGVDAVILGGETGPGARPVHPDWVRKIRDDCQASGVPFFFKQWGEWSESLNGVTRKKFEPEQLRYANDDGTVTPLGMGFKPSKRLLYRVGSKRAGRLLDGREHNDLPWRKQCGITG